MAIQNSSEKCRASYCSMTPPRVSIIVIFFNEERFLEEAIASIYSQTYRNWELFLVDDGSTDRSGKIACDFAAADSGRVFYLAHDSGQNRGMSASRNLGLSRTQGEFVCFLDADDVWLPQKLEEQVSILDQEPSVAMVYGRTLIWHEYGGEACRGARDFYYDLGLEPERLHLPPGPFLILVANKSQTPTTCNALMRRGIVITFGGFNDSFRGMFEDQVFFAKIMLENPVYVSTKTWAKYRQHPNSTSARISGSAVHLSRLAFLRWLRSYAKSRGLWQSACKRAVAKEILKEIWQMLRMRILDLKRAIR
jgi:glycosyltransferase involved in cell wall biosynthesis